MKDCLCCLVNVIFLSSDLDHSLSPCIVHLSLKCSDCSRRVFCFCFFCLLFLFKREYLFNLCVCTIIEMVSIYHNFCSPLTILYVILVISNSQVIASNMRESGIESIKRFSYQRENKRAKDDEIQSVNMHLKERY